ncbi:hypothetical protein M3J09_007825 [Ascochyta lentis]
MNSSCWTLPLRSLHKPSLALKSWEKQDKTCDYGVLEQVSIQFTYNPTIRQGSTRCFVCVRQMPRVFTEDLWAPSYTHTVKLQTGCCCRCLLMARFAFRSQSMLSGFSAVSHTTRNSNMIDQL